MASQGAAWVKEGAWELVAFPYGDGSISPLSHGTAAIHLFAPKCGSHAPLKPGSSLGSLFAELEAVLLRRCSRLCVK